MGKEVPLLLFERCGIVKDEIKLLVDYSIKTLNVFVDDVFISSEEGKKF